MKRLLVMSFLLLQNHCFLSGAGIPFKVSDLVEGGEAVVVKPEDREGEKSLYFSQGAVLLGVGQLVLLDRDVRPFLRRSGGKGLVRFERLFICFETCAGSAVLAPDVVKNDGSWRAAIRGPEED